MENTPNAVSNKEQSNGTSVATPSKQDTNKYICTIQCAIRRRPGLVALPGQDPAERVYKIGASLDARTRGNLKGISGDLEAKFMPELVGVSINAPEFRKSVEVYWSSISRPVPADEPFLKDYEKGIPINIKFTVVGQARKERIDNTIKVEEKIELLNKYLLTSTNKEDNTPLAILDFDSLSDYLLLSYALKYSRVANSYEDIDKSAKIEFYVFEKAVSVKNQLTMIELRAEAMSLYQVLQGNEKQIDAVLLLFDIDINQYDNITDKLLKVDELYNESPAKMKTFVDYLKDEKWETKYLIAKAINLNKLRKPTNTTAIYYGDALLGTSVDEAVLFLLNDEKGKTIYTSLIQEINAK